MMSLIKRTFLILMIVVALNDFSLGNMEIQWKTACSSWNNHISFISHSINKKLMKGMKDLEDQIIYHCYNNISIYPNQ